MDNTKSGISAKINNHSEFGELADDLLEVFPSSRIFVSGGFLFDVFHDNEPHDFDPAIFGPTFKDLVVGVKNIVDSGTIKPNRQSVHFRFNGKQVDLHLLMPRVINPTDTVDMLDNRYQFQLESDLSFNSYIEECCSSDKVLFSAGNIFAEYGNDQVFCFEERSIDDLNNKTLYIPEAERLRFSADPIFRCIKNASTGFSFEERTYELMINKNKLEYILWSDEDDERDLVSLLEDRFLSTLHRVEKQRLYLDGDREGSFSTFIDLCDKSGVLKNIFDEDVKNVKERYKDKEDLLLHIFEGKEAADEIFSGNYLYKNFFVF